MTSMYFLWRIMGTFDSNQMWLLGTYLLSTKNTRSRIVTPQEDPRTLQVWIHVEMSLTSESRPNWFNQTDMIQHYNIHVCTNVCYVLIYTFILELAATLKLN